MTLVNDNSESESVGCFGLDADQYLVYVQRNPIFGDETLEKY